MSCEMRILNYASTSHVIEQVPKFFQILINKKDTDGRLSEFLYDNTSQSDDYKHSLKVSNNQDHCSWSNLN